MPANNIKKTALDLMAQADIKVDGGRPWDIEVKNEDFYDRVLAGGSVALGESYMDGWWECQAIDQMVDKLLQARLHKKVRNSWSVMWDILKAKLTNQQSKARAHIVGEKHYDVGNELYKRMLDKRMVYSCAYWREADNLDDAQEAKLDLICRKLQLRPGLTVLDIGCGWGSLAKFMTENYGVKVLGITISKEQAKLAREVCQGLDVEIKLQDYREMDEKFDRVVSVGMFEHVGYKNYHTFMRVANRCLQPNGLFLLHTIGQTVSPIPIDPWLEKYIFPNAMLPSNDQITKASETWFKLEDWHNFGPDYAKTLLAWHKNFNAGWDEIKDNYDDRFRRMWNYYLLSVSGYFRSHLGQLWQIVFSKIGAKIDYRSLR